MRAYVSGDDVDAELNVHGSFECVAVQLAVALGGVRVAKVEQRAWIRDGEIDRRTVRDLVEVHVASVRAGVSGTGRGLRRPGGGGNAAEHRKERDGVMSQMFGRLRG